VILPGVIEVSRRCAASPGAVWSVLADGWFYATWVVGASRIRGVDAGWPAAGARLHHSVGAWPVLINDVTECVTATAGELLVLQAKAWPVGEARVEIHLAEIDSGGCRITMLEDATHGPTRLVPPLLRRPALKARNIESLRRLAYLAEGRSR
jgi:hypothetical protein